MLTNGNGYLYEMIGYVCAALLRSLPLPFPSYSAPRHIGRDAICYDGLLRHERKRNPWGVATRDARDRPLYDINVQEYSSLVELDCKYR